jgi:hypothetical protein
MNPRTLIWIWMMRWWMLRGSTILKSHALPTKATILRRTLRKHWVTREFLLWMTNCFTKMLEISLMTKVQMTPCLHSKMAMLLRTTLTWASTIRIATSFKWLSLAEILWMLNRPIRFMKTLLENQSLLKTQVTWDLGRTLSFKTHILTTRRS